MSDGSDAGDEDQEPFAEYGELDDQYREPEEERFGPDIPEAPDFTNRTVDPVVEGAFWTLVVVFNIGLIVVSLGVMFIIFQGKFVFGGQITLVGCLVLAYGFYRYRSAKQVISERVDGDSESDADSNHNE